MPCVAYRGPTTGERDGIASRPGDKDDHRTRAIFDGRVRIEGCEVAAVQLEPEEAFHRAFKFQDFDISEISLSSYTMTTARRLALSGDPGLGIAAVPPQRHLYPRRSRHKSPARPQRQDNRPARIPDHRQHDQGHLAGRVAASSRATSNGVVVSKKRMPDATNARRSKTPPDIDLADIPTDHTLSDMLASGKLDGLVASPGNLSCYLNGAPNVDRLFSDYPKVEEAYFRRPATSPSCIASASGDRLPKASLARNERLQSLLASEGALHEGTGQIGHLSTSLPWSVAENDRLKKFMGADTGATALNQIVTCSNICSILLSARPVGEKARG